MTVNVLFVNVIHSAELQTVSVRLVMRSQIIIVKNSDSEHSGVDAVTQEEYSDKTRHLVDRRQNKAFL